MSKSLFAGITSRVLMSVAAGLLVLSYISVYINPAKAWFMVFPGLLFVPLAIVNAVLLVWAVTRRSKSFLIPLAALAPCLFFIGRYVHTGPWNASGKDADINFVSYNVGRFSFSDNLSPSVCEDSIYAFLKDADADIICLQEYYNDSPASVGNDIRRRFHGYESEYYVYLGREGCYGNVTLSRFPIVGKGVIKFDNSANLAIYTDHMVGGRKFRVYNCHFESYNISVPGMVKAFKMNSRGVLKSTEEKMRSSARRRPRQVDKVLEHISGCRIESIVCGDFNDNPMSYTYNRMIKGRTDSYSAAGTGFGATYSMLWPMLRIDYIMYPDSFDVMSHRVLRIPFSDHFPVVSQVSINNSI